MWKLIILIAASLVMASISLSQCFKIKTPKSQQPVTSINQPVPLPIVPVDDQTRLYRQIEGIRADADAAVYMDQILARLREQLIKNGYNQTSLPDEEAKFSKKIGVVFHGSASLKNGWIRGLETIHRTGPATISIDAFGDILIEAKVGVNQASIRYDMKAEFMGLGPKATVTGKLTTMEVFLALRVSVLNFNVTLDKFSVQNTGFLTVKVDGLGSIFDFMVEIIINVIGNTVKRVVLDLLEGTFKNLLNKTIQEYLFPPTAVKAILARQP